MQPWPNEQRGRGDSPDQRCQHASAQEQKSIGQWRGRARNVQMNSARDDEECANNNNETRKLARRMHDSISGVQSQNVIAAGDCGETGTQFRVVTFPMVLEDERKDCNRCQQNSKRRKERGMRFDRSDGHIK